MAITKLLHNKFQSLAYLLFIVLAVLPDSRVEAATEQSLYGGSGIGVMRTADMMLPGEFSYTLRGSMYEYDFTNPVTEIDTTAYAGLSLGWGQYIEIGFALPYRITYTGMTLPVPATVGGMGPVHGYAKLSFTGNVEQGLGTGITIYTTYNTTPPSVWIASGQNAIGFEFNLSHWGQRTGLHANLGYEMVDNRVASSAAGSYSYATNYNAQLGMEMYMNDSLKVSFALSAKVSDTANEDVTFATGFHYIASPKLIMVVGTHTGFPSNRSNPIDGYFVSLTYSPNGETKRAPNMGQNITELQQQNQRIENKLDELDQKMDEMNQKLEQQPGATAPQAGGQSMGEEMGTADSGVVSPLDRQQGNGIRVIVLNASGEDGYGGKVADRLRAKGYEVVAVDRMEETTKETWIHYNFGHADAAVQLGGLFTGNQHVVRRDVNHADIIIIVGQDQLE